jgi:hypothetical protein
MGAHFANDATQAAERADYAKGLDTGTRDSENSLS